MFIHSVVSRSVALAMAAVVVVGSTAKAVDAEKPWDRSMAVGLSVAAGNADSVLFTGSLRGEKIWQDDELRLALDGAYGKSDGNLATEKLQGIAQYKRLFSERLYGTFLTDALHDGVADLGYRLTLAPGAGYYFIKSERTRLGGEVGPGYVVEKYNGQSTTSFFTLRLAERWDYRISDTAKCWQQTEWLPQVDDFENYLLNTEVGIEAALTKALNLRIVGQHRYDNQPAPGRRNYDILLTSALAYKF